MKKDALGSEVCSNPAAEAYVREDEDVAWRADGMKSGVVRARARGSTNISVEV